MLYMSFIGSTISKTMADDQQGSGSKRRKRRNKGRLVK